MKSMLIKTIVMFSAAIGFGCQQVGREVVPQSKMLVYEDVTAGPVIGSSDAPLPVLSIIYPDKTTYVLKVCYHGRVGYVRDGIKLVRPAGARPLACR